MTMGEKILKERGDSYNALGSPLETILNSLNSSIYIADMKSHEIFFMNDHMKDLFGTDLTGSICWKSIHKNLKGPCEFCTNDKLTDADGNPTEPHIWEFYNKKIGRWYELHDQAILWVDGHFVRMEIAIDITDRKRAEQALKESHEKLEQRVKERTSSLDDLNAALRVLLKKRDEDRIKVEKEIILNMKNIVEPSITKLNNSSLNGTQQKLVDQLTQKINDVLLPFSGQMEFKDYNFTLSETQIAKLIQTGKRSKEICELLNVSIRTVETHRMNIRKKMGISNKDINLSSYLATKKTTA